MARKEYYFQNSPDTYAFSRLCIRRKIDKYPPDKQQRHQSKSM